MVAGSYSAGLRGAALADLNRQGFYNAVDDLQERQRQLAMQQSEAASAGLMVPFQDVGGPLTPQIDFGQPVRPIAPGVAGGVSPVAPVTQTIEKRTVPIPQPKPENLGPQGSRLGEFASGLSSYLPQLAQPPAWYSGSNPGENLAAYLRDPIYATMEGRQSAGITGAIGGWFLDTVPEREKRALLQEAANWYEQHGTAFMSGSSERMNEQIAKDPVGFYAKYIKPDKIRFRKSPTAEVEVTRDFIPPAGRKLLNTLAQPGLEGADYNVIVGGGTFNDFSKHPATVGLTTAQGPSTAAGRYQITATTWRELQQRYPDLTDFSPANQDKAAWYLAQERYKTNTGRDLNQDLNSGDPEVIGNVGRALSGTWSSLEGGVHQGSRAGQFADMFAQAPDQAPGGTAVSPDKMPDWAKDLRPAGELSMEYQNVRMMQQALRDQAQTNANLYRTRLARTEQMIDTARNVGDITRLRTLMQERDNMMQELAGVRTKLISDSAELSARESQLAVDGALTQLSFGNIGPVEQVFSQLVGVDVRMELRADGKVNMYYNRAGKPYRLVMDQGDLARNLKQAAFSGERQKASDAATSAASATMENELDIRKEIVKAKAKAAGDMATKRLEAMYEAGDLGTATTTAEGQIFLPPKRAGGTGYIYEPPQDLGNGVMSQGRLVPVQGGVGSRVGLNVGAN